MNIDERWDSHYEEVMQFMRENKRRPSKYRIEEHRMLNWMKVNNRLWRQGRLMASRTERFRQLRATAEQYQRINQYAYKQETLKFWDL